MKHSPSVFQAVALMNALHAATSAIPLFLCHNAGERGLTPLFETLAAIFPAISDYKYRVTRLVYELANMVDGLIVEIIAGDAPPQADTKDNAHAYDA